MGSTGREPATQGGGNAWGGSVAEQELTDADIAKVAAELKVIAHASQWEKVLAVGKLILERFFGDNEGAWRERRRNKNQSIRKLAERPDCPFAKSALTEAVGIHVLCHKHPAVRDSNGVTPTHVAKVLGLRADLAIDLLRTADRESWTVRELGLEATRVRKSLGDRRGRPIGGSIPKAESWARRARIALVRMRAELASE